MKHLHQNLGGVSGILAQMLHRHPCVAQTRDRTFIFQMTLNLADFKSAAIWCRQFNATFGAAALKP